MYYYSLRISISNEKQIESINTILDIESNYPEAGWGIEIVRDNNDDIFSFVDYVLSILSGKMEQLKKCNITSDDISIWVLYEYQNQCNLEFSPQILQKIGNVGLTLCISCWEEDNV